MATTINHSQLKDLMAGVGTSFAGFDTTTYPKTNNKVSKLRNTDKKKVVKKHSTFTGFLMGGPDAYAKRVNTKMDKALAAVFGEDADIDVKPFEPQAMWGGRGRRGAGCLVWYAGDDGKPVAGKDYVFLYCDVSRAKPTVTYSDMDGRPVAAEDVIETEKNNTKTLDLGHGVQVEIVLIPRTISFDSIDALRIDGVEYAIDHTAPITVAAGDDSDAAASAPVPSPV
jgi:hypothetical protein